MNFETKLSLPEKKKCRAVLIRGGGLGDFILSLPLLNYIQSSYDEVFVLTKPSYFCLIESEKKNTEFFELDLGYLSLATVYEIQISLHFGKMRSGLLNLKDIMSKTFLFYRQSLYFHLISLNLFLMH